MTCAPLPSARPSAALPPSLSFKNTALCGVGCQCRFNRAGCFSRGFAVSDLALPPWCDCHWTDPNYCLCRASSLALPRSQERRSGQWVSTAQHKLHTRRCFNPAGAVVASWRLNDGGRSAADSGAKEETMGHSLPRFSLVPRSTTQLAHACRRVKARAKSRPLQRNRTRLQRSETQRPIRRRNSIVQLGHQDELQ